MPIRVWRLSKAKYATTPLSGEGARLYGGRWNRPGTALVYTSCTLALAELEELVHVDRGDAPADLMAVELEIPDGVAIEVLDMGSLPSNWRRYPAPDALAQIGTDWAHSLRSAVLKVPSAVVPQEANYLLNPAHKDVARITVIGSQAVVFDARLFGKVRPVPKAKGRPPTKKKKAAARKATGKSRKKKRRS